ncbi:hypothetical protein [Nocardia sp. NPDC050435]|uniref:4'-phosphopantetheinyl transferase family protein n=1 Tax=Nocardia sp. NPDC050435 TaxID=3155040 RepID=UPI0034071B45
MASDLTLTTNSPTRQHFWFREPSISSLSAILSAGDAKMAKQARRAIDREGLGMLKNRDYGPVTATFFEPPVSALDMAVTLDPSKLLHVTHSACGLTIAVVSIYRLREFDSDDLAVITGRNLSITEAAHMATVWPSRRRLEWLAGRLAAKSAVRAFLRMRIGVIREPTEIAVHVVGDGLCAGKPYVEVGGGVGISHSDDFAIAACTSGPVGIDLERNRRLAPSLEEAMGVATTLGMQTMPVALRWACTEAVLKHFGFGLRVDPREVSLTSWRSDGRFRWRPGPQLRHAIAAMPLPARAWAGEIAGYSLALVW